MAKRVLLMAEAVTFAHVARIQKLQSWLEQLGYQTFTAFDGRYDDFLPPGIQHFPLYTVASRQFMNQVNRVKFPYTSSDLNRYVLEDSRLIEQIRPDLVIGDFRLSLAISCRKLGTPYLSLVNGYWTPMSQEPLPVPPLPFFQKLPAGISRGLFLLAQPAAFHLAARPFNSVSKQSGVKRPAVGLLTAYTQADHILIVEPPGWLSLDQKQSGNYTEIGPFSWTSSLPLPDWWSAIDKSEDLIYISLGSSGDTSLVDRIIASLAHLDVTMIVSGRPAEERLVGRARLFMAPFLNATEMLRRADVFVSNGGSLSMVDALQFGCPVVGIPSNYDQILNMKIAEQRQVGVMVAPPMRPTQIREAVERCLERSGPLAAGLESAQRIFAAPPQLEILAGVINRVMEERATG